uniref:Uncharacterized protein n=1 Tax=Phlebotomus papatasi TaxID=29031 RepID=A0A1B0FY32_PHLPP
MSADNGNVVSGKVDILKGLSGKFTSGRLCAILGPSGAGKSSLLNIISGFKTTFDDGEILINGRVISVNEFRKKSCYILQEFALHGKLTTLETLKIAADLKLPAIKLRIVFNVLNILGLDKNSDTRVDDLSGGECKRLSIGVELLTNPPVMFLDEPTSGLDSISAVQVISHLKDLARAGRTIVCVIHQPSSRLLEFFDDLYVISNGQCIYSGPVEEMVGKFQEAGYQCPQYYNRADFALEVATGERSGKLNNLIQKSIQRITVNSQEDDQESSERSETINYNDEKYTISQWKQFYILLKRSFVCISREIIVTQLKILTHLFVGLLIGGIFYNIGNDDPLESRIFYREYLNNWYGFLPYFYSKILAEIPCLMISTFATLIPVYYITNQPMELERFFLLANIYILTSFVALFSGLTIGTQFSTQLAIFMMPAFGLPLIVFCGYFIHYSELPTLLQPLTFITYFRYIFEGSFQAIYGFDRKNLDCHQVFCYFRSVSKVLELMDMKENTYLVDILGIILWILLFKLLFFLALRGKMLPNLQRTINYNDEKYTISQWKQFYILLKRSFVCISREIIVTQLKILTHLFVGLLIGGIFYNIGNDDPLESRIFYREYLNNWYGFLPYFYSKILAEIPCLMISTFATLIPVYYITNQPMELERFFLLANIYILTSFVALFSGLTIGTQFSTQLAIFMMPAFGLPLIVFCGYFIHYSELPTLLQPLTFVTYFRYIFEGSFQAIYGFDRKNLDCHQVFCYFRSVSKILELMDMKENTYLVDILGIILWILLFKLLFFLALRDKLKHRVMFSTEIR